MIETGLWKSKKPYKIEKKPVWDHTSPDTHRHGDVLTHDQSVVIT